MARIPNWGPSAGQPVPDDQWQAYTQANPPPEGASFVADTAAQPQGAERATLGGAPGARSGVSKAYNYWELPGQEALLSSISQQAQSQNRLPTGMGREAFIQNAQARAEQQRVIQELQRQAAGDMGSLAQQQLAQFYGQARAQQSSLGSTMRGQGAGAAMRGIQQGQAGIQRSLPGEQQMLMLQEQQAAQALLAQMLQQQREQDIGFSGAQASALLGSQGNLDEMMRAYGQLETSLLKGNQGAALDSIRAEMGLDPAQRALTNQYLQALSSAGSAAMGTLSGMPERATASSPSEWSNPFPYR